LNTQQIWHLGQKDLSIKIEACITLKGTANQFNSHANCSQVITVWQESNLGRKDGRREAVVGHSIRVSVAWQNLEQKENQVSQLL
jgi:hypothetical protein